VKMTGVDNQTYSLTGEAYSCIAQPKTSTTAARVLQKDDVGLGEHHFLALPSPANFVPLSFAHLVVPLFCAFRSLRVRAQGKISRPFKCTMR
jgi:hypothetical protein